MKTPSLLRGVPSFSGMTLVSRVLGLVRDMTTEASFGANAVTDAFLFATGFPLRDLRSR